jgi:hypothetical protein
MAGFRAQEIFLAMPANAVPPALGTCVQCTIKTSSAQTLPFSARMRDCSSSRSMGSNSWATSLIVFLRFDGDGAGVAIIVGTTGSSSCRCLGGGMCGCRWCCDTTWTWAYTKVATTTANNSNAIQGRTPAPFCFFLLRAAAIVGAVGSPSLRRRRRARDYFRSNVLQPCVLQGLRSRAVTIDLAKFFCLPSVLHAASSRS